MGKSGSNIFLIISVLLAILIIGGAVMYAKKGTAPSSSVTASVDIESCSSGEQCIVVDTHCGFCCDYKAINAVHEQSFSQSFDKKCKSYNGEFCKCFDLSSYPSCVEGQCQLVKWPDE